MKGLARALNSNLAEMMRADRSSKAKVTVDVLDEEREEETSVDILSQNTSSLHITADSDKENAAPDGEDDGWEKSAHTKRKSKKIAAKNAVTVAHAELAKGAAKNFNENWNDRKSTNLKATSTIADYRNSQARKGDADRRAAFAQCPTNTTAVIGKQGHRFVIDAAQQTFKFGVKFSDLKPGIIVRHIDTKPLRADHPKVKRGDAGTYMDHRGKWQQDKLRFFIIVERFPKKMVELEIDTFGDTGAQNIHLEELQEYINLKPKGATDYVPQIPNAPILEIGVKYGTHTMNRHTMLVRVSCPQTREIDCDDELEKVAQLTVDSLKVLVEARKEITGYNSLAK